MEGCELGRLVEDGSEGVCEEGEEGVEVRVGVGISCCCFRVLRRKRKQLVQG